MNDGDRSLRSGSASDRAGGGDTFYVCDWTTSGGKVSKLGSSCDLGMFILISKAV